MYRIFIFTLIALTCVVSVSVILTGDLEPTDKPAPTMHSLEDIYNQNIELENAGSWSKLINTSSRFQLVMNDEAVLDRETGLVWERFPSSSTSVWQSAPEFCYKQETGQRFGWRLQTLAELASLIYSSNLSPALPDNHPFQNIQTTSGLNRYWTITTTAWHENYALYVSFYNNGSINAEEKVTSGSPSYCRWCVRGGNSNGLY